jgi:NTE family protein
MLQGLKLKIGLALGGGAARGLAHIGVLRALEREKVPIDIVVGTSMGAIIGGAYAATRDIVTLERDVRIVLSSDAFKRNRLDFLRETKRQRGGLLFSVASLVRRGIVYGVSTMRSSLLSAEEFAGSMAAILPDIDIQQMPIPFGAVAVDIESAQEVVLCHGSLRRAAQASSAIPGILPPVRLNGRLLIDGGWVDKVPVIPAFKLGADIVIAVDISAAIEDTRGYTRAVDIVVRANAIKDSALVGYLRRLADIVIEPKVKSVHWADFGAYDHCIQAGDDAATEAAQQVRHLVHKERVLSLLRPGLGRKLAELHLESGSMAVTME